MRNGTIPLPFQWQNIPELEPLNAWYFSAFWDLSTERCIGLSAGPIPESKIYEYAQREEIEEYDEFRLIIGSMDNEYLKYVKEKNEEK